MTHADVNAAFNIAAASLHYMAGEHWNTGKRNPYRGEKELMRQIRTQLISPQPAPVVAPLNACENLFAVME
jgi:hypothetical protein